MVQLEWGFQSFLLPGLMDLENRVSIENLTWQVETLSRATQKGFQIIDK